MTQDASTTPASGDHADQEKEQPIKTGKPAKAGRPEKNLYEPYIMPAILWAAIRGLARIIFALFLNVQVRGRQNIPSKSPFIAASNHLSWTDVPLIPAYFPRPIVSMAKEELFYGKAGWLVRFMSGFPVKRGEGDRQAIRAADEQLKQGRILFIFPEGTRSKKHTLAKGHAGLGMIALRSGVPVVPIAITGSEYAFKKFRPRITITFGKSITFKPKGKKITREDIDEATEQVMKNIASMLPPQYRGVYGTEGPPEEKVERSPDSLM